MMKVILSSGEEITCYNIELFMGHSLLVETMQLSFVQASEIFSNPINLKEIRVELDDGNTVIYYGYQILTSIQRSPVIGPNAISIRLDR